ncbi:hypothetical protein RclHR1_05970013 [Rhizophagus clarus]|uniref:Galactose oxidase n=1 Tax=Rhizophagus clarus TaxID=94130 RepID=A0A2Z6RPY7_9GLOM|nr:hypothetical protein RclHR1_05970013 [Rhizophagus clarus]GES78854.1 hypothetical protein GLOIN_2v1878605 [Rhizophagus clarus]
MLHRNLKHYLILIILIQSFSVIVYGQNFIPEPRVGITSVFVDNKIYYMGGANPTKAPSEQDPESDIFYLNVNPDDKENFLSWVDLKVKLTQLNGHAANVGGINQDSIFVIGGVHLDGKDNINYLFKFDTKTLELSTPLIQGKAPPTRVSQKAVSYEGKIYLYGGRTYTPPGSALIYVDQFDILDTINLNWQVGSMVNSPGALSGYTATLFNGVIYYIGGRSGLNTFSPMTNIYQYDIVGDKWTLKKATIADIDAVPGSRGAHTAILFDDKIYVYGGSYFNADTAYEIPAKETFIMLDPVTLVWSIPPYNSTNVPKLAYHTASIKGALMILVFGLHKDLPDTADQSNNSTYYFYLSQQIIGWDSEPLGVNPTKPTTSVVTKPPDTPTETATPSPQNTLSKTVIVGVSVGSVLVVLTIFVACSLAYKRIKRNQTKALRESSYPDAQGAFNGVDLQISPDGDKHSSTYLQQYPPVYQQFAPQQPQHLVTRMSSPPIQQN